MKRILVDEAFLRVEFEDTPKLRDLVFETVLKWYKDHDAFCGEVIEQSDQCLIDAPALMSDIADTLIHFDVTYKE